MSNASTVQGTNDSSIVSKHAMVEAGYAHDPFLQFFTQKTAPRRSPLINRGYYIRTKALDSIAEDFLLTNGSKQIVSLGAGFDTTYFRLSASPTASSLMKSVYYVEVDYLEVSQRKKDLIALSNFGKQFSSNADTTKDVVKISTDSYCLIGADLGDIENLEKLWTNKTRLQKDLPTLVLSECVMTYMDHKLSTNLIQFCKRFFDNSLFVTYEQVEPMDAFGQFMRSHFDKLNSSLKGISLYSSREKQVERYKSCGYHKVDAFTMRELYQSLPLAERERIKNLEYFDEYEEWHMKCFHYVVVVARTDCNLFAQLERNLNSIQLYHYGNGMNAPVLPTNHFTSGAPQYSHSSCLLNATGYAKALLTHGGFGVQDGKHCRQTMLRLFLLNEKGDVCKELTFPQVLPCRLHHTIVSINKSTAFVFGGRLSPAKAMAQSTLLKLGDGSEGEVTVNVEVIPDSSEVAPRWRHAATALSINDVDYVIVTGGLTITDESRAPSVLTSCHLFNMDELSWTPLPHYKYPVHSHAVCYDGTGYVYSIGGLGSEETVYSDCYRMDLKLSCNDWDRVSLPIRGVFSHNLHIYGDTMLVVGGIGSAGQQMHLQVLELSTLSIKYINMPVSVDSSLRMYVNHTSHILMDENGKPVLVIVGGGGNCFSFGTHINKLIAIHPLHDL